MATGRLSLLWKFPELIELHCRRMHKAVFIFRAYQNGH